MSRIISKPFHEWVESFNINTEFDMRTGQPISKELVIVFKGGAIFRMKSKAGDFEWTDPPNAPINPPASNGSKG